MIKKYRPHQERTVATHEKHIDVLIYNATIIQIATYQAFCNNKFPETIIYVPQTTNTSSQSRH